MYIRKILIGILITGIVIGFFVIYNITQTIFKPITAFNNEEAYIHIPSDADFLFVQKELKPLLTDTESFVTLAKKKGYIENVKGGKYIIRKGMNSNDIVKTLQGKSELVKITLPASHELKMIKEIARDISIQIEASEAEMHEILIDTVYLNEKGYGLKDLQYIYGAHTYTIPWNTSAEEFRSIVYKNYEKRKQRQ
ncbi:hypothetical protein IMCC3317_47620 [Kordia antarctica]|uniref:Aminodeoxychorismate lyase n=1 Tax=Kordia antarctica TaxID=1218801 RepID=A0A7L4ZRY1_9FLAO|nr:endolytic transglycosylase MltG [Kordia antarctica]QHI39352.1 hypothetical protein IMCC3317_47620 [Kordia antarctica]